MYAATILLGLLALGMVLVQNEIHAYILLMLAVTAFMYIRKLGYFEYVEMDKVLGYIRDVADEIGLNKERRTFLNQQIAINNAQSHDELWDRVVEALQFLRIDYAECCISRGAEPADGKRNGSREITRFDWRDPDLPLPLNIHNDRVLLISLPLTDDEKSYGCLILRKDLTHDWTSHYTLRRIEHLRRSVVRKLKEFEDKNREMKHGPGTGEKPDDRNMAGLSAIEPDGSPTAPPKPGTLM
jgi:UDP-GlcNAc:undecaprenyl-phosphate GlcNAc-1-phosphate transferase